MGARSGSESNKNLLLCGRVPLYKVQGGQHRNWEHGVGVKATRAVAACHHAG